MGITVAARPVDLAEGRAPLPPVTLADMASGLARSACSWTGQLVGDPDERTGLRLIATEDYDVWLLRWPPGTSVTPHDHGGSAGAFCVVGGHLIEARWHRGVRRDRIVGPGEVTIVEPGVVHDVVAGSRSALSVHAYSPPLTSMSFYDDSGSELIRVELVEDGPPPLASARILHPAISG